MTALALPAVRPVTLTGRFVRLEPLALGHVPALVGAASVSRETYDWTWVPDGEAEMRGYVEAALALGAEGKAVPFATVSLAAGKVVGCTRFAMFEYHAWPEGNPNQRGAELPDAVEIGWTWLGAEAQRTPINTEAKYLMLGHAFAAWQVHAVRLKTDSRNARSRAAIERIGATLDGVLRAERAARDGALRDTACYSILDSEWPAARTKLEARMA